MFLTKTAKGAIKWYLVSRLRWVFVLSTVAGTKVMWSVNSTDTSIKVISYRYCCRYQGGLILVIVPVTRRSILSTPEVICSQYWHQYEDDLLSLLIPVSRWSVLRTGTGTKVIGSFFLFTMPSISLFRERDTGIGTDMRTRHGRSVTGTGNR